MESVVMVYHKRKNHILTYDDLGHAIEENGGTVTPDSIQNNEDDDRCGIDSTGLDDYSCRLPETLLELYT